MTSLATSVALTDSSPFKVLKTHGIILDTKGEKMSKSNPDEILNPIDFIEGSVKLTGERKFGYGVDTMRAWLTYKDCDK
jgi:isoleucyl-tRNA synthetase